MSKRSYTTISSVAVSSVLLAGCMNGPAFLQQSNESEQTDRAAVVEARAIEDGEGAVVGAFSSGSLTSQVLSTSDDSVVQGAAVTIPPNSLAIDTNITIQEGAAITSDAVVLQVAGDSSLAVASAANAVHVSADQAIDLARPMTVQISIPSSSSLTAMDFSSLAVFYKVYKHAEGTWVQGFLAKDNIEVVGSFVRFSTQHFGAFQAVYLTAPPTEAAKEVPAAGKAISKREEKALPAVVWGSLNATYVAAERSVTVVVTAQGHQDIDFCEVVGDADQLPPFDIRKTTGTSYTTKVAIDFSRSETLYFRWSCVEKGGRLSQSGWSEKLLVPEAPAGNSLPSISVTAPASQGQPAKLNSSFGVTFTAADDDDNARVALYYKANNSGCAAGLSGWTKIISDLKEGSDTAHNWSLTGVAAGTWFVCAHINDGRGGEAWAVSPGSVTVLPPPTVTLTSAPTSPTNVASVSMTAQFSHAVTGFALADINVTNGTIGSLVAVDGRTYTFNLTAAVGTVTVSIPAGGVTDAAGNVNTASANFTLIYDITAPTVSLTSSQSSPTNASTINMTAAFSEAVNGFTLADVTVTGGTKGNFVAQSGSVYTFDITSPSATVTVDVAAGAAADAATNSSLAATQFSIAHDGSSPTVTLTASQTSPTNASTINMTAQFSESVTGFNLSDIAVVGGTAGSFVAVDGDTYRFNITSPSGVITVDVPANAAQDATGNNNLAASQFTITHDAAAPTVTLLASQSSPTNASTINMTVQFSEAVTGFDVTDITVASGTKGALLAVDSDTYTFNITSPTGTVTVDVGSGVALDAAGNSNTAATQFTIVYDNTAPTVALSATQTSPTSASTINMTAQFSESVTSFSLDDISVANGTKGNFVAVDGDTFTFDITSPSGTVTVDIPSGAAKDAALNASVAATQFSIVHDGGTPTVTLSATQTSPTNAATINMTAQFSEGVTGFVLSDIVVAGGTKGNFVAVDGDTYTFDITAPSGTVTVDVAGSVAQDSAGNDNAAASQFSILYDGTAPSVTLSATQTSPTNASTINMTVQFSEGVTGFDLTDITVAGGTGGSFNAFGDDTFTFDITAPSGTVTVDIAGAVAQDSAGNSNTAASQFTVFYDGTAPTVTLSASQASPTNASTINMTVQFSEPVSGFDLADITVGNGTSGNFNDVGAGAYTFEITSPSGMVTVDIGAGVAHDGAANGNLAATQFSILHDSTAPSVTLSATQTSPTNAATINVTAQFSEPVFGFALADVAVANGTKGNFTSVDGDTYTFDITAPTGVVTVDIAGAVAQDAAGNTNTAATQFSITYDASAPTVSLSATQTSPTNASTINMTVQFSEAVTDFTIADITVANGTKGSFVAVDGDTYTFNITAPSGVVTVNVSAGIAADIAGNGNTAASQFSITYDGTSPTVTITSSQSSPTGAATLNMTAVFSEAVSGFTVSDLIVTGGSATGFTPSTATTYFFSITSLTGNVMVEIGAGAGVDAAGNGNTANSKSVVTTPALANPGAKEFYLGTAVSFPALANSGAPVSNCSIAPPLPSGLTAAASSGTCQITGTPTEGTSRTKFTLTGTAANGLAHPVIFDMEVMHDGDLSGKNPRRISFSDTTGYWAFFPQGANLMLATSANGVTWATVGSIPITNNDFAVTAKNGTAVVAVKAGFNIELYRYTLGSGTASLLGSVMTILPGTNAGNEWHKPAVAIGDDNLIYVAAYQGTNPGPAKAAKMIASFNVYTAGTITFDPPTTFGVPVHAPEGISLVPYTHNANKVMAVTKGHRDQLRAYAFNGAAWSEVLADGSSEWFGMSGPNGPVRAMTVYNGDLYVGGQFASVNGQTDKAGIARWDGANWHQVGGPVSASGYVMALEVLNGNLYAAGSFSSIGGVNVSNIAKWNGTAWSSVGSGVDNVVYAMTVHSNYLYVGGAFFNAGGSAAKKVAKTDGTSWWPLGAGIDDGNVFAMTSYNSMIHVGGDFTSAGGSVVGTYRLVGWNGSTWQTVGGGITNGAVKALVADGPNLFVGGEFTDQGDANGDYIVRWSGVSWHPLGTGMQGPVQALAKSGNDIIAGGNFILAGGNAASKVARWDGSSWSAIDGGVDSLVWAIEPAGPDLFIGGSFSSANALTASNLAQYSRGFIAKAKSFSHASYGSGATVAFIDAGTMKPVYRIYNGSAWGAQNELSSEAHEFAQIQVGTSADNARLLFVWDTSGGAIKYQLYDGVWSGISAASGAAGNSVPWIPARIDGTGQVPVLWHRSGVPTRIGIFMVP